MAKFKVGDEVWIIRNDLPRLVKVIKIDLVAERDYFSCMGRNGVSYGYREESLYATHEDAVEESHANLTAQIAALQKRREDLRNS